MCSQRAAYLANLGGRFPSVTRFSDGTDDGSRTGTNSLGHDGVQVLDVQWLDRQLCGFSGGFASTADDYALASDPVRKPEWPPQTIDWETGKNGGGVGLERF